MNRWSDRLIPHLIFCVTTCLVLFGLVMVYSSSAFDNYKSSRDKWETLVQSTIETVTVKAGAVSSMEEAIADLVRMYFARIGTSQPNSFSTAKLNACSEALLET